MDWEGHYRMYRILIVEDTPAEADLLSAFLATYAKDASESFTLERLTNAVDFLERRPRADLIFMDIQMPGINGMEAAEILRGYDEETPLVFVTNLAQYAVEGYAVDALDFLVKPVTYEAFCPRMDRALRIMRRKVGATVALPSSEGERVVAVRDIGYVDMFRHDLYYHLASETEPLRLRGSMKVAEEELSPHGFLRISSGCLVNMAQVKLVRQGSVVLGDGTELFFSRARKRACMEALANYVGGSR